MRFGRIAIATALIAGFVAFPALAADIKKEQKFRDAVVGKKLVSGDSWVMISADGKIAGVANDGQKITGAWAWSKKYWCRNVYVGQKQFPEDCQKVSMDGDAVTFTREKGKGKPITYTMQ